jgi:hypothetical protein
MLSNFKLMSTKTKLRGQEFLHGFKAGYKEGIYGFNIQEKQLTKEIDAKDNAYWERGQLVAYLSRQFDSHIINASGHDSWPIVCIHSPKGQLSWHIPSSELQYYVGLPVGRKSDWDGHTTEEKYARLWELTNAA